LGYDQSEFDRHDRLQERITYAVREDVVGEEITDYQTVRLNPEDRPQDPNPRRLEMQRQGWTTWAAVDERNKDGENARRIVSDRDYWADAVHTVAVTLDAPGETPTLDDLDAAVRHPARPLFLGRKPCLPADSLFAGRMEADSLPDALVQAPLHARADDGPSYAAWWPTHPDADDPSGANLDVDLREPVTDRRDWKNQIHVGERWIVNGTVTPTD